VDDVLLKSVSSPPQLLSSDAQQDEGDEGRERCEKKRNQGNAHGKSRQGQYDNEGRDEEVPAVEGECALVA
jgi:hypothetical protein